jgi:DnaJ family protein C protein 9
MANVNFFFSTVRSAFLKAALTYHPDKAQEMEKQNSTEKFQLISKIYEMLKDGDLRQVYDKTGINPLI